MNFAISDMAELARQTPKLADQFEHLSDDAQPWLENATKIEGSAPFFEAWDEFLNLYGSRGSSEIDIYIPSLARRPAACFARDRWEHPEKRK